MRIGNASPNCSLQATPSFLDCGRQNSCRDNQGHASYECDNYRCVFHRCFWLTSSQSHSPRGAKEDDGPNIRPRQLRNRDLAYKRLIQMRPQPGNAHAIEPDVPVHDDHRHRGQFAKHRQQTGQFAPEELTRLIRLDPHHGNDLFCGGGCVGPVVKGAARRIGSGFAITRINAGNRGDALFHPASSIAAMVEIAFPSSRLLT